MSSNEREVWNPEFLPLPAGSDVRIISFIAWSLLLAVLGCSKPPYELAEVHGTVKINDRPFNQGKVMFAPIAPAGALAAGKPAFGALQNDGSFVLSTYGKNDGAVVGDHWVTVIRIEDNSPERPPDAVPKFTRVTVPAKQTVVAGQVNQFHLSLSNEDVLRFGQTGD